MAKSSLKNKKRCLLCGNNPVSHINERLSEYLSVIGSPLRWVAEKPLGRGIEKLLSLTLPGVLKIGEKLSLVSYETNPEKAPNGRSKAIWEEAVRRNIPMTQIVIGKAYTDFYRAYVNSQRIYFESLPIPAKQKHASGALRWVDDKGKFKKKLQAAHIPTPDGGSATSLKKALRIFKTIRKPVIVKPALGSRGRHTTTLISTEEELKKGFKIARQIARKVIIEEHLIGSVYRGTVINGKLVGVLRGDPPRITGDGTSTITQLIEHKNKNRHPRVKEYVISPLTEPFLKRLGHSITDILPKGKTIDLTEKIGLSYGGMTAEEFNICHPKTKAILEQAGKVVNFPVMGFDFIIEDITKDPDTQIWGIIECNSLPFIDLHHHPVEGTPINAAKSVWDLWF